MYKGKVLIGFLILSMVTFINTSCFAKDYVFLTVVNLNSQPAVITDVTCSIRGKLIYQDLRVGDLLESHGSMHLRINEDKRGAHCSVTLNYAGFPTTVNYIARIALDTAPGHHMDTQWSGHSSASEHPDAKDFIWSNEEGEKHEIPAYATIYNNNVPN